MFERVDLGLWGMDFRISLVIIATLVVTERPLAAGDKDLVWAPWLYFTS